MLIDFTFIFLCKVLPFSFSRHQSERKPDFTSHILSLCTHSLGLALISGTPASSVRDHKGAFLRSPGAFSIINPMELRSAHSTINYFTTKVRSMASSI
jgi:hypothetical protein